MAIMICSVGRRRFFLFQVGCLLSKCENGAVVLRLWKMSDAGDPVPILYCIVLCKDSCLCKRGEVHMAMGWLLAHARSSCARLTWCGDMAHAMSLRHDVTAKLHGAVQ